MLVILDLHTLKYDKTQILTSEGTTDNKSPYYFSMEILILTFHGPRDSYNSEAN